MRAVYTHVSAVHKVIDLLLIRSLTQADKSIYLPLPQHFAIRFFASEIYATSSFFYPTRPLRPHFYLQCL